MDVLLTKTQRLANTLVQYSTLHLLRPMSHNYTSVYIVADPTGLQPCLDTERNTIVRGSLVLPRVGWKMIVVLLFSHTGGSFRTSRNGFDKEMKRGPPLLAPCDPEKNACYAL